MLVFCSMRIGQSWVAQCTPVDLCIFQGRHRQMPFWPAWRPAVFRQKQQNGYCMSCFRCWMSDSESLPLHASCCILIECFWHFRHNVLTILEGLLSWMKPVKVQPRCVVSSRRRWASRQVGSFPRHFTGTECF